MKKYLIMFAGILITAVFFTGCDSYAQTGYNSGNYNSNYGNDYGYGYGDGQPNYYYYNDNQSVGQAPVGFNDFYNQLSPYGYWVNIVPYGPVWIANVANFQPYYSNGYWAHTNYGWTWVSNYTWGWAPFHYGRWGYNDMYGWYWVPGYVWGPAWVAWSSTSDMYGWAPLMPGMDFNTALVLNSFPSSYWTFVHGRYMGTTNIGNYYQNRSNNVTIIKNTTIVNNYGTENNRRYSMGPNAVDVQRYTGKTVQTMHVTTVTESRSTGINNNELRVYRPVTAPTTSSTNNRATNNNSPDYRTNTTPARTQPAQQPPAQQPGNRVTTNPQTRTQPANQQTPANRTSQSNPVQPKVNNNATLQTSKQIQAAQNENKRIQQQSPASTPARR